MKLGHRRIARRGIGLLALGCAGLGLLGFAVYFWSQSATEKYIATAQERFEGDPVEACVAMLQGDGVSLNRNRRHARPRTIT